MRFNSAEAQKVLIETYWNVKMLPDIRKLHQVSINRNILECKGRYSLSY